MHRALSLIFAVAFAVACSSPSSNDDAGTEGAACRDDGSCDAGLVCASNYCVMPPDTSDDGGSNPVLDVGNVEDLGGESDTGGTTDDMGTPDADDPTADGGTVDMATDVGSGEPPVANIVHPGTEDRQVGMMIPFIGEATDPEDGDLDGMALVWTSDLDGEIGTGKEFSAALSEGTHTVTLTATDSDGNTGDDTLTFNVVP